MFDLQVVSLALADIGNSLCASISTLQWIVDAYALTLVTTLLVAGGIADRYGLGLVYRIGVGMMLVATLLCALSPTIEVLIALRAVQGIGGGIVFAGGPALIADRLSGEARSRAYTAYGLSIALAFGTAPIVGGALVGLFGWRSIFFAAAAPPVVVLLLVSGQDRKRSRARRHPIDWSLVTLFVLAMSVFVFGLIEIGQTGSDSLHVAALMALGFGGLLLFGRLNKKAAWPLLDLDLLRDRLFACASVAAFTVSAVIPVTVAAVALYFQAGRGYSSFISGLSVAPLAVGLLIGSALSLSMARVLGHARALIAALSVLAAGFTLLALWSGEALTVGETAVALGICGLGHGALNPSIYDVTAAAVPEERLGMASGLSNTFRQLGVASGVALFGSILAGQVGRGGADAAGYGAGLRDLAIGAGVLCLIAVAGITILSARRPRRNGRRRDSGRAISRR